MKQGLDIFNITDTRRRAITDADNLFWAILPKGSDESSKLSRDVLRVYDKFKDSLDKNMHDFRFSKKLSAVYINPTDKCNASCPYCYVPPAIRKNGRSMNKEELEFILNKIYKHTKSASKKMVIVFHASEPLLVKDVVFSAINKFKNKFLFGLQTNALLLTKKDVDFLIKHRVGVGISLDSQNSKINNRLRSGNFNQVNKALKWFNGYAGLNVITTVTKYNVRGLEKLVRFLHKKKVSCILLNPVRLTQKYSRKLKPDQELLAREFLKAVDTAIDLTINSKRPIIIANFANIILGIVSPFARRLMCDISPCGGGRCFFTITARGEMIPCGEFIGIRDSSGGNIFRDSITKAIESKPFKSVRGRFVEKIEECDICTFRNICGSPCPAELHAMDRFNKKAVFCEFYKKIIQHAFKLIAQGKEKHALRKDILGNLKYEYQL